MKIWIDDIRPAPEGYVWVKSVTMAKALIYGIEMGNLYARKELRRVELLDLDHDAGDFAHHGGDYIEILNWMERNGLNYPIHIHSMNPVGVENMRRIIKRNNWREV